jgi:hypothetical protein
MSRHVTIASTSIFAVVENDLQGSSGLPFIEFLYHLSLDIFRQEVPFDEFLSDFLDSLSSCSGNLLCHAIITREFSGDVLLKLLADCPDLTDGERLFGSGLPSLRMPVVAHPAGVVRETASMD